MIDADSRITVESPLGPLLVLARDGAVCGLLMTPHEGTIDRPGTRDPEPLGRAREQLAAYFAGDLTCFDLPLAPAGTPFQQRVWRELLAIPFGETISYGALAERMGRPGAARAVGLANASNPISIIVPCHRVIGTDGKLTGYGGGLGRKAWLLDHEAGRGPGQLALPLSAAAAR